MGSGRRLSLVFMLNMMAHGGDWVRGGNYGSPRTVVVKLNTSYEVPVGSEFFTLYYVKLALYVVTSVHPAEDRFGPGSRSVPVAGCGRVVVTSDSA